MGRQLSTYAFTHVDCRRTTMCIFTRSAGVSHQRHCIQWSYSSFAAADTPPPPPPPCFLLLTATTMPLLHLPVELHHERGRHLPLSSLHPLTQSSRALYTLRLGAVLSHAQRCGPQRSMCAGAGARSGGSPLDTGLWRSSGRWRSAGRKGDVAEGAAVGNPD